MQPLLEPIGDIGILLTQGFLDSTKVYQNVLRPNQVTTLLSNLCIDCSRSSSF